MKVTTLIARQPTAHELLCKWAWLNRLRKNREGDEMSHLSGLKPDLFSTTDVRAEARTLPLKRVLFTNQSFSEPVKPKSKAQERNKWSI
jgi:hypothetical protein